MSYDIALYRIETKEKEEKSTEDSFFENDDNLIQLTEQQFQELKERLLHYDYEISKEDDFGLHFEHQDEDYGTALLTRQALYFIASWNEDSIFEIGMTASEFTDTGEYAKYDFQNKKYKKYKRYV